VGYRWMDANNATPLFPFGHGLSYSSFAYSELAVVGSVSPASNATVYATVCLGGGGSSPSYDGAEVAQLYLSYPEAAQEPPQLLKGFAKVALSAADGGCAPVSFELTAADLSVYIDGGWTLVPGTYGVRVGSSSRDIRLTGELEVTSA
jgi:beta-glucosidase